MRIETKMENTTSKNAKQHYRHGENDKQIPNNRNRPYGTSNQ